MTKNSRELLMQAIRSIHIEKLITPARMNYDFIIQDRGLLSNTAYGLACGNSIEFLEFLSTSIVQGDMYKFYDDVILLTGNVANNLEKAIHCKKEFESGDAMESRGVQFIEAANKYLLEFAPRFNAKFVDTTGKDIESVFSAIINSLGIRKHNGRYY
jgi:thymidylate kinase